MSADTEEKVIIKKIYKDKSGKLISKKKINSPITFLVNLLDASGSIESSKLKNEFINGFNAYLKSQKEIDDETYVITYTFNRKVNIIHDAIHIRNVDYLTEEQYVTIGSTSLNDSIYQCIKNIENKIEKYTTDQEIRVLINIITDGKENSSIDFPFSDNIKEIINDKQKSGWNFIYQAANLDVQIEREKYGFLAKNSKDYSADKEGVNKAFSVSAAASINLRSSGLLGKYEVDAKSNPLKY